MLRVCHIVSGDLWAGAEVMVYHLLKGMRSYDDLELSVILLNEGRLAEEIRKLGIKTYVVDESVTSFFHILLAIRKLLSKRLVDVIHSHRVKENILACLISRSIRGIRLIGTQHGMPEVNGVKHRLNFFVLSRCFCRVLCVSQDIKENLVNQHGFENDKVGVIHNGIMVPDIQLKIDSGGSFVIGSAGRFFPVKDYPFLVEIAKEVLKKTKNISFQLAGDGPDRNRLKAIITSHGIDSEFVLKGHLEDMSSFYRGLDLYINTSIHEGIPISILEAMAHGLPVVAPKVGGLTEIVEDEVDGFLLEDRDPKVFAEKCLLLHENKELRQRMSHAAKKKVLHSFSVEGMARQYYNLYLKVATSS